MKFVVCGLIQLLLIGAVSSAVASEFETRVSMRAGNATTFYVKGVIGSLAQTEFMVDTGSGYMTINEQSLQQLQETGQARYLKDLIGVLANGEEMVVPVYELSSVNIGGGCVLHNVEAAVFPGKTRQILGLNALKQAAPFIFSFDPPQLMLSHCRAPDFLASRDDVALDQSSSERNISGVR